MKLTFATRATPSSVRTRVLVVDDDADGAEIAATLLGLWGHEARWVRNGADGVREAASFGPHVVFVDLQMPVVSGFDVARTLRAVDGPRPYLVALSGLDTPAAHAAARDAGFDEYVVKPANGSRLRSIVAGVEDRARRDPTLRRTPA